MLPRDVVYFVWAFTCTELGRCHLGDRKQSERLVRKLISLSRRGVFTPRFPYWLPLLPLPTCVFSPFILLHKLYGSRGEISTVSMAGLPTPQRQSCSARRLPVRCQNIPCQKLTLWPVDCSLMRCRSTEFCLFPCRPKNWPCSVQLLIQDHAHNENCCSLHVTVFPHILFHRDKGANVSQS